ncbi:MAG: aminoglycoside phosphotransferase family protein [Anaerolineae bacterium]|nr:aminoglycoside phosphotransferase family protein [Anaerolineae bacterium]MCO5205737.1 aminoglycoside phosphotransferase family protein [Anaerolineae bacterium]
MSSYVANEVLHTNIDQHPAALAWQQWWSGVFTFNTIVVIKERRKSGIIRSGLYRLTDMTNGRKPVIAKRQKTHKTEYERFIYENILSPLPIATPEYLGHWPEPEGEFSWVFLEDVGDIGVDLSKIDHRRKLAEWTGIMHASAANLEIIDQLPLRGAEHYLEHAQSAFSTINQSLTNNALASEDGEYLNSMLRCYENLIANWSQIADQCRDFPVTFVHGDLVHKNMRVQTRDAGETVVVFDWETSGQGLPAPDLASIKVLDIASYLSPVQQQWPNLNMRTIERLAELGSLFRTLAAINWEAHDLLVESPWVKTRVARMQLYCQRISRVPGIPWQIA